MGRIPKYMRADAEEIEIIKERTRRGLYDLDLGEIQWRDKADVLLQHGYRLRSRLMPGWTPSWEGTDLWPEYCEDSVRSVAITAVDATRISNGMKVMIKRTSPLTSEAAILRFLNSPLLKDDPSNHCVPLLDIFPDKDSYIIFIAMPLLREFYEPTFESVEEALEFVNQTLVGIDFMHNAGVAHLDCTANNIMMDGFTMFPNGFHPVHQRANIDGHSRAKFISRSKAKSVKYYYMDFGISRLIRSEADRRMKIRQGAAELPPEIEGGGVYDPFPVDLYYLGHVYREYLLEPYANMEFLRPLIEALTQQDPKARPSAPQALSQFDSLVSSRRDYSLRWRLRKRNEGLWSRSIRDFGSISQEALFIVSTIATSPIKSVQSVINIGVFRRRRKQSIELPDE